MSNKSRDYDLELFNVMNALGDVEWEMSEDELLAELHARGQISKLKVSTSGRSSEQL